MTIIDRRTGEVVYSGEEKDIFFHEAPQYFPPYKNGELMIYLHKKRHDIISRS
jgi:hypothetical protein